jgi:thiamine-phosphate pyrophosphorylase
VNDGLLRLLDAALNRAREALRAIEDAARFACDDHDAAAQLKSARHELAQVGRDLGSREALASRDVAGDVGRETKTTSEVERGSLDAVLAAEFARAGESLRSIAEFGKLICQDVAARAESIRYRVYQLEQAVRLRGTARSRLARARLYVLLTESLCKNAWQVTAEQALAGGADAIQLREKSLPDAELRRRAQWLRELTRERAALLILNDRPDVARLVHADGVHVGQDDLSVADARRAAGGDVLVGMSTHTREQIRAAIEASPDYIAVGPMFPSATKPQEHIAGRETLALAAEMCETPLVAIGGVTARNVGTIAVSRPVCVAVCSAVISAADPAGAVRELIANG